MNVDVLLWVGLLALLMGVWRFYRLIQAEYFRQKNILHTRFVASYVQLAPKAIPVTHSKPSPRH